MGLFYGDLTPDIRRLMIEEIDMDVASENISLSRWLTQGGQGNWPDLLKRAATEGSDVTLATEIRRGNHLVERYQKRKPKSNEYTWAAVPHNGHEVLAEIEFNNYFCRALCRHAIENRIPRLEIYRAKAAMQPRPESQEKIGTLIDPLTVLTDLRASVGSATALGIPAGPGTGLTLRIPRVGTF
ncbi:MAG: hypothetical protein WC670_11265 [Pseudolabrys sp.]